VSKQIVDSEHIRVMVWAGLRPHADGPLTWVHDSGDGKHRHQLVDENADQVGAMLSLQNLAAYEERYDEGAASRPYSHSAPRHTGWTPADLFTAVEFYVYQSFHDEDHDEPLASQALQYCGALVRRIGPELPGWGTPSFPSAVHALADKTGGPWGIDGDTTPS